MEQKPEPKFNKCLLILKQGKLSYSYGIKTKKFYSSPQILEPNHFVKDYGWLYYVPREYYGNQPAGGIFECDLEPATKLHRVMYET